MAASIALGLYALADIPAIVEGDDLAGILGDALSSADLRPQAGDVLVVTQKIVSKAEGRRVNLGSVTPSDEAKSLAAETGKDAAICALILEESTRILRKRQGLIISEHRLGMVMANAGIDQSNTGGADDPQYVLLLPEDPDASAASLASRLSARFGEDLAVVISDSVGRAWRKGVVGMAIGSAGLPALIDLRGRRDLDGRPLQVTEIGLADDIASAALLLMGEADEGRPAVLLRGLTFEGNARPAKALQRPRDEDLFR